MRSLPGAGAFCGPPRRMGGRKEARKEGLKDREGAPGNKSIDPARPPLYVKNLPEDIVLSTSSSPPLVALKGRGEGLRVKGERWDTLDTGEIPKRESQIIDRRHVNKKLH